MSSDPVNDAFLHEIESVVAALSATEPGRRLIRLFEGYEAYNGRPLAPKTFFDMLATSVSTEVTAGSPGRGLTVKDRVLRVLEESEPRRWTYRDLLEVLTDRGEAPKAASADSALRTAVSTLDRQDGLVIRAPGKAGRFWAKKHDEAMRRDAAANSLGIDGLMPQGVP